MSDELLIKNISSIETYTNFLAYTHIKAIYSEYNEYI